METNQEEIWKPVKSFEGIYAVSDLGRVKGVSRITSDGKKLREKLLTPSSGRYPSVDLWKCGVSYNKLVSRLVAEAFIPNPTNLPEVNHIDGNKQNNYASNLEWSTSSDNIRHAISSGLKNSSYRVPVKCIETQEIFDSLSAAGRFAHTDATRISESIDSKSCCKGYTFIRLDGSVTDEESYVRGAHEKYQDFHVRPVMSNSRRIQCTQTRQVFDSIAQAATYYGCDTATVSAYAKSGKLFKGVNLQFV